MFIVNELQELKVSGARHRIMVNIDEMVPEFYKEFTLNVENGKKIVVCDFQDNDGKKVISFVARGKSFTDALNHIKRQVGYYDRFNENYYAGGEDYKCV